MKKLSLALVCFCKMLTAWPQGSPTSADIYLGLKKLEVLGSVLYIAAHPDDENTRLLTYFSKDRLYRTAYLSLTRGDGGQNLIGDEQGVPLGLIRTQELLSARRIDGAEQFFTRAYDFGYSKTPEETFTKWDHKIILADVVWMIRKFQPDIIVTRFPTTGEGGHGHHTASAILANEAFTAAADPSSFPEQLKTLKPWQAKRIVWNTFSASAEMPPGTFRMDVGGYNPVLGKSYGEIAAESRSQHKSQGFGVPRSRGEAFEYFTTTGGTAPVNDLMDGTTTTWERVPGGAAIQRLIKNMLDSFAFDRPQRSLPALLRTYAAVRKLPDSYWKIQKAGELKKLIEQASGLWVEAFTNEAYVTQDDTVRINFSINDRLGVGVQLKSISVEGFDTSFSATLAPNRNFNLTGTFKMPASMPVTQPYWLAQKMEEGYFNIPNPAQIGQADVDPAFTAYFKIHFQGSNEDLFITRTVNYKYTDPVKGEQNQPVTVVPPVTVYANPELLLLKKGEKESRNFNIQALVNKNISFSSAAINTHIDSLTLTAKDTSHRFVKGGVLNHAFTLPPSQFPSVSTRAYPSVTIDGKVHNMALATVKYDHIPLINYFYSDWVKLVPIDLKTKGHRIGYIVGAGDKVPQALEEMGYEVTQLSDRELARNHLQQFDAIITGVRAYNTNEWLDKHYDKLMEYVKEGGNLIVQYNTSNNIGPVRARIGPYDFDISRNRITDENAPVTFLNPDHPSLNYPNKITEDDFTGWIQERSIYQAARRDSSFEAILRMNDPREAPNDGSLVIAKYGKGYFTYTGLVFFRELPAGVAGAYRLMANLIALNQKKEF